MSASAHYRETIALQQHTLGYDSNTVSVICVPYSWLYATRDHIIDHTVLVMMLAANKLDHSIITIPVPYV